MVKLTDMAHTPAEIKEERAELTPALAPQPMYPYGLCLCLGNDEIAKLGLAGKELDTGDILHLMAMAKVTSVTKNDTTEGQKTRVELQITQLGVSGFDEEEGEENDATPKRKIRNPYGK